MKFVLQRNALHPLKKCVAELYMCLFNQERKLEKNSRTLLLSVFLDKCICYLFINTTKKYYELFPLYGHVVL